MITVPAQFAAWRARLDGEPGRAWVRAVPGLVERLLGQWGLVPDDAEPLSGGLALVVLVRRGDQRLALRLSYPGEPVADEVLALRAWRGRGAVCLVEAELVAGALLLERLDHTRTLHALPLGEAAAVAGALIRTLAVAAPPGLRTVAERAAGLPASIRRRQGALGDPVPPRWVEAACRYAVALPVAGEQLLVHADLHYGNVLAGTRQPWSAIDPRAVCGAPEYAVPELMWTRADELRSDAEVRGLLDAIVAAGQLDVDAAYGWVVARCVDYWLWGLERGLTVDPLRCERILRALVPARAVGGGGAARRRRGPR